MSFFDNYFCAGKVPLYLAPMSGFSDIGFRALCKDYGADVLVSEFVQSEPLIREKERTWRDVDFTPEQRPMGIQIFGADPTSMSSAARLLEERLAPDFIDLNFGCPARKVVEQNAGSGLLRDLMQMEKIARGVVSAVPSIPITAKIRIGWDSQTIVAREAARCLENAGIRVLVVHGRTKAQGYSGESNWDEIGKVVCAVKIPVVGNGDIRDAETALRRVRESGVAGLMIGRGALGKPWIFSQIKAAFRGTQIPETPSADVVFLTMFRYAKALAETRGLLGTENIRWLLARLYPFTYGVPDGKRIRSLLSTCFSIADLRRLLNIDQDF